ncbi:MAG: sigma-70 family RNA polymerase sigma factor, partial [Odoribacter sp.]|nr:sigma-70 family RNA polymerase sigma factor [Odoribacter sp.]
HYGLEQMEAEDVVIEVIHHIWEIRTKVKSPASLYVFFFTAVQNRTMNVLRNLKNRNRIIQSQEQMGEEFYDYVTEEEITRLLDEAVKALPDKCRTVVLMVLQGNTSAEIARAMNISVNTVKTYKMRAVELLRGRLADNPLILLVILFRLDH